MFCACVLLKIEDCDVVFILYVWSPHNKANTIIFQVQ